MTARTSGTRVAALVLIVAGAACGRILGTGDTVCTADFRFGISMVAYDSVSGTGTTFTDLKFVVTDGAYRDSLFYPGLHTGNNGGGFAGERAGTYDIAVTAAGYRPWTKTGVVVTRDDCHVRGVSFTARLVALP